ncbi:MAG: MBL fold metallo-hydrolase [Verrucomicrobium sp.]|nr:MBL fold metallo-hydrolase [Verrucomicrobium sp.]
MPGIAPFQVHTIDLHFQGMPHLIAAYLLESDGELALIETGPGATLPKLIQGIQALGFDPVEVRKVLVTHIHLDHAGAAGWWAQQGATVYVHARGASHLIDPSKLISSAERIYGDRMESLWGEMLAAPAERVVVLNDGDSVKLGRTSITALDTPGHARHHHAFACGDVCFTGDVAGMRLPGCDYLSVTAAPPQFDPVAYDESLERLHSHGFARLFLTHFGEVTDVAQHLANYSLRVHQVHDLVQGLLDQGLRGWDLREAFLEAEHQSAMQAGATESEWSRYEAANPTSMGADGIALYCEKSKSSI